MVDQNKVVNNPQFNTAFKRMSEAAALFSKYTYDKLTELEIEYNEKLKNYAEVTEKLNTEYKQVKLDTELSIKRDKLSALTSIANELGYGIITTMELKELRLELTNLGERFDEEVIRVRNEVTNKVMSDKNQALKEAEMNFKLNNANIIAENKQLHTTVESLTERVNKLEGELREARLSMVEISKSNAATVNVSK